VGARDSCSLVVVVLVALVVCSVVTELVVDALLLLQGFLLVNAGKSLGLKRYLWGVLQVGGLLNCLVLVAI